MGYPSADATPMHVYMPRDDAGQWGHRAWCTDSIYRLEAVVCMKEELFRCPFCLYPGIFEIYLPR